MSLGDALIHEDSKVAPRVFDGAYVATVLTMVNAALGAGVLAYPYAFMSSGQLVGTLSTCVMAALSCIALFAILRSMAIAESESPKPIGNFGDLVRWGIGDTTAAVIEVLVVCYAFGACLGYLILLGDVLTPIIEKVDSSLSYDQIHFLVLCCSTGFCVLLCLLRRISMLKYSACIAVFAVLFTVGMLVYQAFTHPCRPGKDNCNDENAPPNKGWESDTSGVVLWPQGFAGACRSCHSHAPSHQAMAPASRMHGVLRWFPTSIGLQPTSPLQAFSARCP